MRSNRHSLLALIAALMMLAPAAPASADDPDSAAFFATSTPPGAYVYLDGEFIGRTPLKPVPVPPGAHEVWFRSRPPGEFEPLPLPAHAFTVAERETMAVSETVGRLIRIESDPAGARIMRGDRLLGTTPTIIRWHDDGENAGPLRVARGGYFSEELGAERLRSADLIEIALYPTGPLPISAQAVSEGTGRGQQWTGWGTVLLGAGSTALALHFKNEADVAYDRYSEAALPAEMNRELDRADRYDRYATVAWVVAELSFVSAILIFTDGAFFKADGVRPTGSISPDAVRVGARWQF